MAKKARGTKPLPRDLNDHLAEMEKTILSLAYRQSVYTVFCDFVECSALALSNWIDLPQKEEREKRYLEIIKKYRPEEVQRLPNLLGMLTLAMEEARFADVLGTLFTRLELHNHWRGQFFTPFPVCLAMAKMLVHDAQEHIAARGFLRASEPAVGSGAMVIALAQALKEEGINYQQCLHVTAIDLDIKAIHMAYTQLTLYHVPAVVIHGDTLRGETYGVWYTPAHLLGFWEYKLRRATRLEEQARSLLPEPVPALPAPPTPPALAPPLEPPPQPDPARAAAPVGTQLTLF
jgi:hypothetical protein